MLTLEQLNAATADDFVALLDGTYEHSPWIAERAAASRPFASLVHLKLALAQVVRESGRDSPNTRRLVADHGGLVYDSDHYGDDLPFWLQVRKTDGTLAPHLVVPYTLDTNDMRFSLPQGFSNGDEFFEYLRDTFDVLYEEGDESPTMMSIGMHCRLLGRPGRMRALQKFLDHVETHDRVWITRRVDIARHWKKTHPFDAQTAFVWE